LIAFHDPPAVIAAALDKIDLLNCSLPDIPRIEPARSPIKREPPRVTEAERVDLGPAATGRKRIIGRDRVRLARLATVDIDPEDLSE
jgi:hypothetical protein